MDNKKLPTIITELTEQALNNNTPDGRTVMDHPLEDIDWADGRVNPNDVNKRNLDLLEQKLDYIESQLPTVRPQLLADRHELDEDDET